ncbi:PAS domain-containing protein [Methylobacterium brachiatum]|uniref:Blue-light-activated histidine kinase n=1 Tax=Methylobacterium brachiatum TaxID=269660 RepID=A0ABV1RAM2_9HYPH
MEYDDEATRRQAALASYDILDTEAEAEFDEIVQAASAACGMPVSLISLLDNDRQWFKAETGFGACETPLSSLICAYAAQQRGVLVIPDTLKDPRTATNPLVTGGPQVRFYAGVPLETADGIGLGALCVLDTKPNQLTAAQVLILRTLARQVMTTLELRRALKERGEIDRRNSAILDSAIDYAIITTDLEAHVTGWNVGAERILGWCEAEMRGKPAHVFFTDEDVADGIPDKEMGSALMYGRGTDERWHQRKDGSLFWANGEMMALRDEGGTAIGFLKMLRDRTEQRNAAAKQQADAEFMRSVLSSSADCIKVLDLDARLTFMSEGGMRVMEVSDFNAVKGCPWPDFWMGQGHADAVAAIEAARAGGVGHFQGAADTFAGTPRWWDVQVTPILGADGCPEKLLSVSRDITDQKTTESMLAASEERWRGLFTGMHEGFFSAELIRDASGQAVDLRFIEINPAFAVQSGLPANAAGRTVRDLIPNLDQSLIDTYGRVVDTGTPETFEVAVPELARTFEVRARKRHGQQFAVLFLDISERKRAEARRAAMTALGDRLRGVNDKADIARIVAEIMGTTLGLSHAGYGEVDPEQETILVADEFSAPGLRSIAGLHRFREYGSYIESLKAGEDVIIPDVTCDPRTIVDAGALKAIDTAAVINLPLMEHGRFVGLLYGVRATPTVWAPEDIAFMRTVADRTRAAIARVEAEEQQRILNQELSHRLKNTLTLVQSIASQTLRNAETIPEAREALAARLIALGKSHDILLNGRTDSAAIGAVIEGALALHQDRQGRFRVSGPDLRIGPSAALSLSLMLHELATNATKYGALSRPAGHVDLIWAVHGTGPEAEFQMIWAEHDGPPVSPPTRTGFGSRLIQRGLAGGTVEMRYPTEGVICTLTTLVTALMAGS